MVGHYPWFVTYNYLDFYLPKRRFQDDKLKALVRNAGIGFCSTLTSDTISNSIRVVKTIKQTSSVNLTYKQAIDSVIEKEGI